MNKTSFLKHDRSKTGSKPIANRSHSALLLVILALSPCLQAANFNFSDDFSIDIDTSITYGAQWRVQSADEELLTGNVTQNEFQQDFITTLKVLGIAINMDDGNRNFDTGLITNRLTLLSDLDIKLGKFGGFLLRGKAFYDDAYAANDTDMSPEGYVTYNSATNNKGYAALSEFDERARAAHGDEAKFLDAFYYTDIPLGKYELNLRVGRQAISWGESTFYGGISAAQNRIDATVINAPGVEVKEILLPTGAIYGQFQLSGQLSFESYYQYEWIASQLNGSGAYFSTNDQLGPGARSFLVPLGASFNENTGQLSDINKIPIQRLADNKPGDSGQWGIALRYETKDGTEFGIYNLVYHDKKPSFVMTDETENGIPDQYIIRYFDDIRLYGFSVATEIASVNLLGEIHYSPNTPVVTNSNFRTPIRGHQLQATLGSTELFGPTIISDDLSLTFEAIYLRHNGLEDNDLEFDAIAYGYSALFEFVYNNVFQATKLTIPLFLSQGLKGTVKEANITAHAKVASIGLKFSYLEHFQTDLTYTSYFGGGFDNWISDRDNVAINLKYTF